MMNISKNIVLGHRNVFRGRFFILTTTGDGGDRYLRPHEERQRGSSTPVPMMNDEVFIGFYKVINIKE